MHTNPMISNFPPARLTEEQARLTSLYADYTFKYRLASAGGDMFLAADIWDKLYGLEKEFKATLNTQGSGLVAEWA